MSEPRQPLRRIVVAGDGPLGVLAAIALKRALPPAQLVVIGTPPDPAAFADRSFTALPFANRLHDSLGVSEEALVRRCGASHRLITRYVGARAEGEGVAGYGAEVDPKLDTGFARNWGAGPRNASTAPAPGSLGEALAASGRFAPLPPEPNSPLATIDYALRWNVPAYRDLLIGIAHGLGVQHVRGAVTAIEPDGHGGATAVAVEGAGPLTADLFVDCSGSGATLLSGLADARWIDWADRLPARSIVFAEPGVPMLSLEDRLTLTEAGWRWEIAGRDGRMVMLALGERKGEAAVRLALGGEPSAAVPIAPRCAAEPWMGNVVALGDAAACLEPTAGFALDLAHRQLHLLLELLPGRGVHPLERAEFNRRARLMAEQARDALAAHYACPPAAAIYGEPDLSPDLELVLDQWTRRGRVPFFEESPLLTQEWASLLHALGFPAAEGTLARAEDQRQADTRSRAFAGKVAAALRSAPPYGEWMNRALARQ
jgi:tryptophan 7-halogenase